MGKTLNQHIIVVILAGGGGTRLWPRSTIAKPKQFLRLFSDKTILQETYLRIKQLVPPERVLVITNQRYKSMVHEDLPEVPRENVIAEPMKKDTAMAMGVGAVKAMKMDPEAVIINLAADHVVDDIKEFQVTMLAAVAAANMGDYLVTVGIHPTFPHTGLGYIKVKDALKRVDGMNVFSVDNFTEKPKLARAKAFIATGKYFWNANNYVWTAKSAMSAFQKHLPVIYSKLIRIGEVNRAKDESQVLAEVYPSVEPISIDYGISEKASNLLLIPGDFGWNDIGDWQVVYDLSVKDKNTNVIDQSRNEKPVLIESAGCFVNGGKKLLAMIGINDAIVVETRKALLIVPRNRAQDVKHLVELMKEKHLEDYL